MKKRIFLDCGTHLCEGINEFIDMGIILPDTEIHTFEPNPECRVSERIKKFNHKIIHNDVAVWVEDGETEFKQENHKLNINSGSYTDGTSYLDGWASSIKNNGFDFTDYYETIIVKTIDFNKYIDQFNENDELYLKMDIEGSEYKVLENLIKSKKISKFTKIWVEFHDRFMIDIDKRLKFYLIRDIERMGVRVYIWK